MEKRAFLRGKMLVPGHDQHISYHPKTTTISAAQEKNREYLGFLVSSLLLCKIQSIFPPKKTQIMNEEKPISLQAAEAADQASMIGDSDL